MHEDEEDDEDGDEDNDDDGDEWYDLLIDDFFELDLFRCDFFCLLEFDLYHFFSLYLLSIKA